ncbi:MAG: preQ(1) synthase, partial [Ginsengibacter sp.]
FLRFHITLKNWRKIMSKFPKGTWHRLKALGSSKTKYSYDKPDPKFLERFPSPLEQRFKSTSLTNWRGVVKIVSPEFTSLCPKTGQPDFATIVVEYQPDNWCVESKSLKLYLMGYRNFGEFHESCVQRIANDLVQLLSPRWLVVEGQFTPRGGIPFWPRVEYGNNPPIIGHS